MIIFLYHTAIGHGARGVKIAKNGMISGLQRRDQGVWFGFRHRLLFSSCTTFIWSFVGLAGVFGKQGCKPGHRLGNGAAMMFDAADDILR